MLFADTGFDAGSMIRCCQSDIYHLELVKRGEKKSLHCFLDFLESQELKKKKGIGVINKQQRAKFHQPTLEGFPLLRL